MADMEKVIYDIERCICHVPDACRDCSKYKGIDGLRCMEELMTDAYTLLKEQEKEIDEISDEYLDLGKEMAKQPKPKTARWEKRTGMMPPEYHGHYWCSNCDWHGKYNEREADYKFCPACGAKMEG